MNHAQSDFVIIGGGIAGLWLLNLLRDQGYATILLERGTLGGEQTLASQGMIHGGIKYALAGTINKASETIKAMPARWNDCLAGVGSVDLRGVTTLSKEYYMFSDAKLSSKVTAFFGSKAIAGRVQPVSANDAPTVFKNEAFKGLLYALKDIVLDATSLIAKLRERHADCIYHDDVKHIANLSGQVTITLNSGESLATKHCILAAGQGNGPLIDAIGLPISMQLRPLAQVIVKGPNLPDLYAHAVSLKTVDKPRVTITTHTSSDRQKAWYLGGELSETGVARSDAQQIAFARQELKELLPWVDLTECAFSVFRVNRAEAGQSEGLRPDRPFVKRIDQITVCWPTKLTLIPLMGDEVLAGFDDLNLQTSHQANQLDASRSFLDKLPPAVQANPPWEI